MTRQLWITTLTLAMLVSHAPGATAQQRRRPASPPGMSATQIGTDWIEIEYGRPILRGRADIFGSGPEFGTTINDGAPAWRAGANHSTRLRTDVALEIGGQRVPPGEHVLIVELSSEREWTLIVTDQPYQRTYDPSNTTELWGAFNYKPDWDVARAPMTVETLPYSVDQLTWTFTDVSPAGGTLRVTWARMMGSFSFKVLPTS